MTPHSDHDPDPTGIHMTDELHRLRARSLRAAYCNPRRAYELLLIDTLLAALADHAPQRAEQIVTDFRHPSYPTPDDVLHQARDIGLDTTDWPRLAADLNQLTDACAPDPHGAAQRLWNALLENQPAIAAALAQTLRELPNDWLYLLFRVRDTQHLPPADWPEPAPETAPWSTDPEDCAACSEVQDMCRYHEGFTAGHRHMVSLLTTLVTDDFALDTLAERHAMLAWEQQQELRQGLTPEKEATS
jgi:hypothetical protein